MPLLHLNEEQKRKDDELKASQKRVLRCAQDVIDGKITQDKALKKIEAEIEAYKKT